MVMMKRMERPIMKQNSAMFSNRILIFSVFCLIERNENMQEVISKTEAMAVTSSMMVA
jgi:hypothetical protein